jgi:hypothetical protein
MWMNEVILHPKRIKHAIKNAKKKPIGALKL